MRSNGFGFSTHDWCGQSSSSSRTQTWLGLQKLAVTPNRINLKRDAPAAKPIMRTRWESAESAQLLW